MSSSPDDAVRFFRRRFRALGQPARAAGQKAYMKSALRFHGVTAAEVRAAARDFCAAHRGLSHDDLVAIVDALFATDWFDLRSAGIELLDKQRAHLDAADLAWLLGLVRRGACWAHVDYLATKIVGDVVARDARVLRRLPRWAKDDDLWVRRTALLAQLGTLRRGGGDFALFTRIAVPMLGEKEFFIRKAIGWVLREVSKKRPALVAEFVREHGARAAGLTLREATKYLPASMR